MLMDPSITEQTYIEDCEVCCNPIEVTPRFLENELVSFETKEIGQ